MSQNLGGIRKFMTRAVSSFFDGLEYEKYVMAQLLTFLQAEEISTQKYGIGLVKGKGPLLSIMHEGI